MKFDFEEVLNYYRFDFRKQGSQVKIPCPFHSETKPSLSINLERNIFHCFGCGESGNIVTFVQKMEGCNQEQALKLLESKFEIEEADGYNLEALSSSLDSCGRNNFFEERRKRAFLYSKIIDLTKGKGWNYWKKRGIKRETFENHLLGKVDENILNLECEGVSFKYMVGRYTIPYVVDDVVVNVQTRASEGDTNSAKYIPIIPKQRVGLYNQKALCRETVVICEGAIDTLILEQNGITAVGVPGVRTFSSTWTSMFYGKNLYVCYDNDDAGRDGVEVLKGVLDGFKIIKIPRGHDVNDFFLNYGGSAEEFRELMRKADIYNCSKFEI